MSQAKSLLHLSVIHYQVTMSDIQRVVRKPLLLKKGVNNFLHFSPVTINTNTEYSYSSLVLQCSLHIFAPL